MGPKREKDISLVLECVRLMLRPIVRLCLRRYVRLQDFIEISKVAFVDIAQEELEKSGDNVSASRITVVSGVHRKDVSRILAEGGPVRVGANLITRVIAHWEQDKRFCTKAGKPKVLDCEGRESEFAELVKSVSAELNPYSVLYELERMGTVERSDKGLRLQQGSSVSPSSLKEGFAMLARDTEDLMEAVEDNLSGEFEPPNLHLRTEYDNILVDAVPKVRAWLIEEGSSLHRRARAFLSQYDKDVSPSDKPGGIRVVLGAFSRVEQKDSTKNEEGS